MVSEPHFAAIDDGPADDDPSVGVRELKANLSKYLAMATAGKDVIVTDRNRPIARIVPFAQVSEIERGIEEGWIEAPRRTRLEPLQPVRAERASLDVLAEDRQ